jgi:DNA-binding CsgD family transcriptional regulator
MAGLYRAAIWAEIARVYHYPRAHSPIQGMSMAPRLRQTLDLLLLGDGEKQIAGKLKLSPHTVHQYVKAVYKRLNVSSRAELLALWVRK